MNTAAEDIIEALRKEAAEAWDKCEERRLETEALKAAVVKRLDWQERYQTNADQEEDVIGYVATTGLGAPYRIERDYFATTDWQLSYGGVMGNFYTPEEAKDAAQADFKQRVLSCLAAPVGVTHRHLKSGHLVEEVARGKAQVSVRPIEEMSPVAIYRHEGNWWVRHADEFDDGRFEAPPQQRTGQ